LNDKEAQEKKKKKNLQTSIGQELHNVRFLFSLMGNRNCILNDNLKQKMRGVKTERKKKKRIENDSVQENTIPHDVPRPAAEGTN
jgi:hypothetical protein